VLIKLVSTVRKLGLGQCQTRMAVWRLGDNMVSLNNHVRVYILTGIALAHAQTSTNRGCGHVKCQRQ
jgi:hypothetical protein